MHLLYICMYIGIYTVCILYDLNFVIFGGDGWRKEMRDFSHASNLSYKVDVA